MFTATIEGFDGDEESPFVGAATRYWMTAKSETKRKGESIDNMLHVVKTYIKTGKDVEAMVAPRMIPPLEWAMLIPHFAASFIFFKSIGWYTGNYPNLLEAVRKETKYYRELLEGIVSPLVKDKAAGVNKVSSDNAENIWKWTQRISLNVGAANMIVERMDKPIYTPSSILTGLKDAPKDVSEVVQIVTSWTTDYVGQVIGKAGAGVAEGLKKALFEVPWYGWLVVGGAAVSLVAFKTAPAWMPLVRTKLAARGLAEIDEFGFNPYHDGQGKFVRPEQLELRRSQAKDRFGTDRPWGSYSDGKGTQEKFIDAAATREPTSVPCGTLARKQHKNIRCGDGAELPYGYAARYSLAAPKKVRKSRSKKALQGYGEFNDSPANEAKLARFIDHHLTNVGPRELLQQAKRLAASDHHILAALHVVKDEATELYREALKIEREKPCAKAKIGQALKDLNIMIKAVE